MPKFNPMQIIINRLQRNGGNNPMVGNVIQMAQNNDISGLENFARNIGKEKGINVDDYYNKALEMFGMTK